MPRGSGSGNRPRRSGRRKRWSAVEREWRARVGPLIAGIDEVGRGPLAGPVVACAVIMPPEVRAIAGVDDSKQLPARSRLRLAARIQERALALALGAASVREIERLNIYRASTLAMSRALRRLPVAPDHVLVDGRPIRALTVPHTAIVGGDSRCYSIACASIVAKVTRDRLMVALGKRYPGYSWERNVGYATPTHLRGLSERGLTPHHRRTFFHVRQLSLDLEVALEGVVDAELAHDLATDALDFPEAPPERIIARDLEDQSPGSTAE